MLIDSKIFNEKNIFQIHNNDLTKAKKATIFLVHWKDYESQINEIISLKEDSTALIVYAPQNEGKIESQEIVNKIGNERNSILVNFRGRLINDIVSSIITTSFFQK